MKIKTSELTGAALDWVVAKCEGIDLFETEGWIYMDGTRAVFRPSTDWRQGGTIIEREGIETQKGNPLYFPKGNENGDYYEPLWIAGKMHGPTPLIAAMRCLVASKLGDKIEVPDELL